MTFLSETQPTARKQHRCDLCSRAITPGEKYRNTVQISHDAGFYVFKECAQCRVLMAAKPDDLDEWYDHDFGWSQDDVSEWARHGQPSCDASRTLRAAYLDRWRDVTVEQVGALIAEVDTEAGDPDA